ncbi:50S ribosomal protein L22 [Candidatus Xiphinematobacter sp. Idaho Grape]|uniref:50S ribosomal protein L22 n=1 Tax=Candidatus Xiphinematobacter sp. Idaho Grape TaxID=1704307 RepID=UPI000705DFE3|nr:50S ribosomal protein L22 [Candidatus Xiphinematobacter sp. Idaho Grape]ALJ56668.1 50S ribosomal protein L22 [Candidatus Xiphinematobacter sp. Idaho Grape]
MQVKAVYKYARISAFKAREVIRSIRGLPALEAVGVLQLGALSKKASPLILRTLKSAIANARSNGNVGVLVVKEATVGEGPTFKRFRPKARGSAGPIRKRTSHITVVLSDAIEVKQKGQGMNREPLPGSPSEEVLDTSGSKHKRGA